MSDGKIIGFDPMTGEPIKEEPAANTSVEEKITGYDPMTGEPVKAGAANAAVEEKIIGYDPMTGAPITEGAVVNNKKPMLTGSFKKLLIPILAVAAVVVVVLAAVFSGVFVSSHTKVLRAVGNTFLDESRLSKACQGLGLLATDAYTVSVKADIEDQSIEGSFAVKKNKMQLTGKVDIQNFPEIEGVIGIDSEQVRGKIDLFDDTLFVYDFTKDNDGYLMEQFNKQQIEMINTALTNLTSNGKSDEVVKDITDAVLEEYKEWDIEKAKKKKFEVDGKKRNCAGYSLELTGDNLQDLVDAAFEALEKHDDEGLLDELADQYDNMFSGMRDVETTIYIYKNMLAAIVFEADDEALEVLFEGGDFRTQNVVIEADGKTVLELKGKTDGAVEEYDLEVAGEGTISLEYDSKSGDLEIEVADDNYGDKVSAEANLKGSKNEFAFTMDMKDFGVNGEVELSIEKGASIQKISGDEFNIGEADEDDWEELAEDLYKVLY